MNKYFLFFFIFFLILPAYSHGEDINFKPKYKEIKIDKVAVETLGIKTRLIKEDETDEVINTTGQIEEIPKHGFDINCSAPGRVLSVFVDLGDKIQIGQSLATIQSTDVSKLLGELSQAKAELELAKVNLEREKQLFDKGVSAKKDYDFAMAAFSSAEAMLDTLNRNLHIITGSLESSKPAEFIIKAKKTGVIVERDINVGQLITPDQTIFRGIDLSTLWASADIYQKDIGKVSLGQAVRVMVDGIPDKTYEGKIDYIGAVINKDTKTLPVKATLDNKNGELKTGAFIELSILTGKKKKSLVIPKTALLEADKEGTDGKHEHLVYLKEKNKFVPRRIEVESHDKDFVEIVSGLMPGDVIVTNGAYQLQFEEDEDEHEHLKSNILFSPLVILIMVILALFSGFMFGRKKGSRS